MRARRAEIQSPVAGDARLFVAAVRRSRRLHGSLVKPPVSVSAFRAMLASDRKNGNQRFLAWTREPRELVGVFNISSIIRGPFNSAFLGYYAFEPQAGRGLMSEALGDVLDRAFGALKLHRLEANIQPENERSIALVRGRGFREEGYSPRYLKIAGRWRDHVRFAILAEEWRVVRRTLTRARSG